MAPPSTTPARETSLIAKELEDVTAKHAEIVQQIKDITEVVRAKNEELQRLKEHGLVVTGAKAILESMTKTLNPDPGSGEDKSADA